MNVVDQAFSVRNPDGPISISGHNVVQLCRNNGLTINELMLCLLPLAERFAIAETSGLQVGAIAEDESGALYFGANIEFAGCDLRHTIHAEQSAMVNAVLHSRSTLRRLAVSAAPCGMCRQFLHEFMKADELEILFADQKSKTLAELLPETFGSNSWEWKSRKAASGLDGLHRIHANENSLSEQLSLEAAKRSHAPYSGSISGCCIESSTGKYYQGPYLENAAFNPSISAFQAAIAVMKLHDRCLTEISTVTIAQLEDSVIDHFAEAESFLRQIKSEATIEKFRFDFAP